MKKGIFKVLSNTKLCEKVYRMELLGDCSDITASGQFVNIALDGLYLRRPISVCDVNGEVLTIIYKVVGKGTEFMSGLNAGAVLDVLTGLGNGYNLDKCGEHNLLIGGGVGVPPLYLLAKKLKAMNKRVSVVLGFNTAKECFYLDEFKAVADEVIVTTVDGSLGVKGFVTDGMMKVMGYDYFYTCGPELMLKAVYNATEVSGQFSFEERMGCGFGACMGCSCKTKYGNKRICKDGPVLEKEEIIW